MVSEGQLLWTPTSEFAERSNVARYMTWLKRSHRIEVADYEALRKWSVTDLEGFWGSNPGPLRGREQHAVPSGPGPARTMPATRWFEGSRLNYAEHLLRYEACAGPAAVALLHPPSETRPLIAVSWQELGRQVRIVATQLRALGIGPGDRIVAYMPNVLETLVAMLATTAIGAVWASAAPEFGARPSSIASRRSSRRCLLVADGYRFGGKDFDRAREIAQIVDALPTLQHVVRFAYLGTSTPLATPYRQALTMRRCWKARRPIASRFATNASPKIIRCGSSSRRAPRACPKPSCTVTSASSSNSSKARFNGDGGPERRTFFYTTTGWMMWNALVSALLSGTSACCTTATRRIRPRTCCGIWPTRADHFGASPTIIAIMQKPGLLPGERYDVSPLEMNHGVRQPVYAGVVRMGL